MDYEKKYKEALERARGLPTVLLINSKKISDYANKRRLHEVAERATCGTVGGERFTSYSFAI